MSQETGRSSERSERKELPIERGFPIERVNEIAQKEGRAKQWYRPIYTMHKWWARRLGCVFRTITLYSLLDDPKSISVHQPGENGNLGDFGGGHSEIQELLEKVDLTDPESLWELFPKDVRVTDKKVLDPFMGGGTSVVEASRFGATAVGCDINPVAWFVTKKQLEAGQTDINDLKSAFEKVEADVADEITKYYQTPCPNGNHKADVVYYFWVKELDCTSCGNTVPLFNDYRVAKGRYENDDKYNIFCPGCESIFLVDDWRSEATCSDCGLSFDPEEGNVAHSGDYSCPDCGQRYSTVDAIKEQDGFNTRLFTVEYYCPQCDENGRDRGEYKGYKEIEQADIDLFDEAVKEWEESPELDQFVPSEDIPPGSVTQYRSEYTRINNYDVFDRGYHKWTDMFNERQLLGLSKLLSAIDDIEDRNIREYLLLTFSESLNYNNSMIVYNPSYNKATNIFKVNAFDPPRKPIENNIWGTKFGTGTFTAMWDMVIRGVEYAKAPTERYIEDGETCETPPFSQPIGVDSEVYCGDARKITEENEFDAVITDPPYYDNIIYSEVADYFYVWQRILLKDEYEEFQPHKTPRKESIVANPAENKGEQEFESELHEAFGVINKALKDDGVLAFTYHHSNVDSWGELLEALCDVGFIVTATYPISADINKSNWKLSGGSAVEFDIIIVARPADEREPTSWNSLRRKIYRTSQETQSRLENNRDLSAGDIGVIEMGRCFHEYSKHHGRVQRAGEIMTAKEVVQEIYGIIQQGSEIGEIDVFLDLLESPDITYNDLNKLTRGTDADPDQMEDMRLYRTEGNEFILGTWEDEKRMAYIQERVNRNDKALNALDKAQFLRYRYEQGKSTQNYLSKWDVDDELRELCEGLADATGDDTYKRILGADTSLGDY